MDVVKMSNMMSTVRPFTLICALILFAALQIISTFGQIIGIQFARHHAKDNVERRVILDSAFLDVGNATLNTPVNTYAVGRYIDTINEDLAADNYPIRVASIQGVNADVTYPEYSLSHTFVFENAEQKITLIMQSLPMYQNLKFSWWALVISVLLAPAFAIPRQRKAKHVVSEELVVPPKPKLVINLRDKTLGNSVNDTVVILQNKPLCFYTALVKYCTENPEHPLPPHKDVPIELIALANKAFARLIELGHTKRKRPDFNANLDKTLSEIRASLDEVFALYPEEKERYYPPRAQGEGSRSKQHSYALTHLSPDDVEIIGN
jgi:hypothetical protein